MNERIKELAEQAGYTPLPGFDFANDLQEVFLKKFAELIVLECEKVAKDPQWYSKSPSNSWRNPINHVCSVMKEHFGVKE